MTAIHLLVAEHRVIEKVLDAFQAAARRYASGEPPGNVEAMLRFFQTYGDAAHHAKEERILFPALQRHGVGPDTSVVGALSAQHESCRLLLRELDGRLKSPEGGTASRQAFAAAADEYAALLRAHIELEDGFFERLAADRTLSMDEDDELVTAMLAADDETFHGMSKAALEGRAGAWRDERTS
jgi:hemerythrin-like domain-containing protein